MNKQFRIQDSIWGTIFVECDFIPETESIIDGPSHGWAPCEPSEVIWEEALVTFDCDEKLRQIPFYELSEACRNFIDIWIELNG